MNPAARDQKRDLRKQVRLRLQTLTPARRAQEAEAACRRLNQLPCWRQAASLLLFHPLPDEPDIRPLLQGALAAGKLLALPRYAHDLGTYVAAAVSHLESDLRPGEHGTLEPGGSCPLVPMNQLDFILVPGVAFTLDGRRLGRGKGYYDRLLAGVPGRKVGIAFDEQIVDWIPLEAHDCRLDCILTPTLWQEVPPGAAVE